MYQKISSAKLLVVYFLWVFVIISAISVHAQIQQQYPQQPIYNQQYDPYGQQQDENYSAKSPFKLEIAKLEATVYRPGEEPIPLSQIPRLNQGDVLKVKISNEPVNGIMPHQSNWDWTLAVAFINPSRNNASEETLSQEIRLREKGWYNDSFFTVKRLTGDPRCSQNIVYKSATTAPIIFPITKESSFLKFTEDKSEVSFAVETSAQSSTDSIQVQLFGGEMLSVAIKQ